MCHKSVYSLYTKYKLLVSSVWWHTRRKGGGNARRSSLSSLVTPRPTQAHRIHKIKTTAKCEAVSWSVSEPGCSQISVISWSACDTCWAAGPVSLSDGGVFRKWSELESCWQTPVVSWFVLFILVPADDSCVDKLYCPWIEIRDILIHVYDFW